MFACANVNVIATAWPLARYGDGRVLLETLAQSSIVWRHSTEATPLPSQRCYSIPAHPLLTANKQ